MSYAFADRRAAGRALSRALAGYAADRDVVVLGLPRGGVPVAFVVAQALHAPLDAFAVRKLGVPGHEELAMGAVASGGICILDGSVTALLALSREEIERVKARELAELARREQAYRDHRSRPAIAGKNVIVIDDGLATGSSMHAAVEALRSGNPANVVVAVPVGSPETCERMKTIADDVVCVLEPADFRAVGMHYVDFRQTTDEEVRSLLALAAEEYAKWTAA